MKVPHTLCPHTFAVYCRPADLDLTSGPRDVINSADTTWDNNSPASLERLVIRALATNIEAWCPWLIQALGPDHVSVVLEELSLNLPLNFCIKNVPDGFYWQRRALASWPGPEEGVCDISNHGDSWRRLFLERHIQSLIEKATPRTELQYVMQTQLREAAPYVHTLNLRELQAGSLGSRGSEQEIGHLRLEQVLALLPALQELRVRAGPRECGLKFAWSKFTLSNADSISLNEGFISCPSLVSLRICSSHVTDETLELLLVPQPRKESKNEDDDDEAVPEQINYELRPLLLNLTLLDLSHNELHDNAAEVLGNFLSSHIALTTLRLVNNKLGSNGAEKLAECLGGLRDLDLSLNLINDAGGIALSKHCTQLHKLRLGGCGFTHSTAQAFAASLSDSKLQELDLSNNNLTSKAGVTFLTTLTNSKFTLEKLDLRMTGIEEDDRQSIMEIIRHTK